ncbi:hypothetical protein BD626DRAFT_253122 [Schizophyllum amplum]|uniref:Uncharacterized protein n=1 Tax=Schizophyllum amplum TaxID=97359 RepID=A0A550CI53_9AGAR|nr:hypothetical protein BD626DRAFT_253122 [Auriculariopsis ampla]
MADTGHRQSPRFRSSSNSDPSLATAAAAPRSRASTAPSPAEAPANAAPRRRRAPAPSQLSLPPSNVPIPLPTSAEDPGSLPEVRLDSPLTPLPASPSSSVTSDDMPHIELAPGITLHGTGRLPTIENIPVTWVSLANPSTCSRVVGKFRSYGNSQNLADGAFMSSIVTAFESEKMRADIRQTAARRSLVHDDLTYAQLETVLKDTFIRGGAEGFLESFRTASRLPDESPHDFMDRIDGMNFDLDESHRISQAEIISRVGISFPHEFSSFCSRTYEFSALTTWVVPPAVAGDPASSLAHDASVGRFKDTVDKAWSAFAAGRADVGSMIDAALLQRGLDKRGADDRKRALSTASHYAQLPEAKRATSGFASNAAVAPAQAPRHLPSLHRSRATVNAVSFAGNGVQSFIPRRDLGGHIETLKREHGCFGCLTLQAPHGGRGCDATVEERNAIPRYQLDSPGVVDVINDLVARGILGPGKPLKLRELEAHVDQAFAAGPPSVPRSSAAATAPNNIPVRVNAVPAYSHVSPDSSYEDAHAPVGVNMIHYSPAAMATMYAGTGLPGRVAHVANVRSATSRTAMGPPPLPNLGWRGGPPAAALPPVDTSGPPISRGRRVEASFAGSDEDCGYDDDYISQPAPPRRSATHDGHVVRLPRSRSTHRSPSRSRSHARSDSRPRRSLSRDQEYDRHRRSPSVYEDARSYRSDARRDSRGHGDLSSRDSPAPARRPASVTAADSPPCRSPARAPFVQSPGSPLTPVSGDSSPRLPPRTPPSPSPAPRVRTARTEVSEVSPARTRSRARSEGRGARSSGLASAVQEGGPA